MIGRPFWKDKTEEYAGMAVHALRKRVLEGGKFAEMEKSGAKESSVAEALFGPSEVKRRVMSLYDRWVALGGGVEKPNDEASAAPEAAPEEGTAAPAPAAPEEGAAAAATEGEAAAAPAAEPEPEAEPDGSRLTLANIKHVLAGLRKLPNGELWGEMCDKLEELPAGQKTLGPDEFYLAAKAEMDASAAAAKTAAEGEEGAGGSDDDDDEKKKAKKKAEEDAADAGWKAALVLLENRVRGLEQEAATAARAEEAVLRELFLLFDKDDSGALSVSELAEAMNKAGGFSLASKHSLVFNRSTQYKAASLWCTGTRALYGRSVAYLYFQWSLLYQWTERPPRL